MYDYIKNYKITAVDLSRQKELDVDPGRIQQIELLGQLKNSNGANTDSTQPMFVLMIKETRLKFYQGSVTVL